MEILDKGHSYLLDGESAFTPKEVLNFVKKEKIGDEFVTVKDGTTNEEVLRVLINRLQYLDNKNPCEENKSALLNLHSALGWLNRRTAIRSEQGVEGSEAAHVSAPVEFKEVTEESYNGNGVVFEEDEKGQFEVVEYDGKRKKGNFVMGVDPIDKPEDLGKLEEESTEEE